MNFHFFLVIAIVCVALAGFNQAAQIHESARSEIGRKLWDSFKTKYLRNYTNEVEEKSRFKLFIQRLKEASEHDEVSSGFKMGINAFSDRKPEELLKLSGFKSSRVNRVEPSLIGFLPRSEHKKIPTSFSWADIDGVVGPVKDQGDCGSCWAFATTGVLEGQERLNKSGSLVGLSEQQLVDCDRGFGDNGCEGGEVEDALNYVARDGGLQREADYRYKSGGGKRYKCRYDRSLAFATTRHVLRGVTLNISTEDELKERLFEYGPIGVGIHGSLPSFIAYQSGVYYDRYCSSSLRLNDHAVLLVGYGTTPDNKEYWIIKNSWSEDWGIKGYAWIARNRNNHCGILNSVTISVNKEGY